MTDSELLTNIDFDDLLYRLSQGDDFSETELRQIELGIKGILNEDRKRRSLEDLFAAVTFIRKLDRPQFKHILLSSLNVHDPLIVSLSLETLVLKWNTLDGIEEHIITFALGVPFDHDGDIRGSSIICMGHMLAQSKMDPANSLGKDLQERYLTVLEELSRDMSVEAEHRELSQKQIDLLNSLQENKVQKGRGKRKSRKA